MDMIYRLIDRLVEYGLQEKLIAPLDRVYARNRMLTALKLDSYVEGPAPDGAQDLTPILEAILDWAFENGRIPSRYADYADLLDAELTGILTPWPSEIQRRFSEMHEGKPRQAAEWFYRISRATNYIRTDRVARNRHWTVESPYGTIDITINLSKPEKDPKAIAAAKHAVETQYPKCLLCLENLGYGGRPDHPARQNIRVLPVQLNCEQWYFQYSPYVYYNEHAIIFSERHVPMRITRDTFVRLLDFIDWMPHYFIGSNADLPIVGGSMLSHDHYQGGNYTFAMERAPIRGRYVLQAFPAVACNWLHWPLTVLRLESEDRNALLEAAETVRSCWSGYSDPEADVMAFTGDTPHNTVTPIARKTGGAYQLDVVLRNNRQDETYPDGIFHPHPEIHAVKRENIGLIEVMGLAVLPDRLVGEMELLEAVLASGAVESGMERNPRLKPFKEVLHIGQLYMTETGSTPREAVQKAVGDVFVQGLEHCGVFKDTPEGHRAVERLMASINSGA